MLVVMAGLPGVGKSSIAAALAQDWAATVVSVDPIEAAMWRAGVERGQPTGLAAYVVAEAVAREQLTLGRHVIVDAVNADPRARQQWRHLAADVGARILFVHVECADRARHRARLETRRRGLDEIAEPAWADVEALRSAFEDWSEARLRVDSGGALDENVRRIRRALAPQVRPAVRADIADMARVHVRSWRETYRGVVPDDVLDDPGLLARREELWTAALTDPRYAENRVAVAERDGEIVGIVMTGPGEVADRTLFVLYVVACDHSLGAGRALLETVTDPDESVELWVAADVARAQAFYRRAGFTHDGAVRTEQGIRTVRLCRPPVRLTKE